MGEIKEYYKIYFNNFWGLIKDSVGWKDITLLILSLVFGTIGSFLWKGKEFMIDQTITYIAYSLLPLILIALIYVVDFSIRLPAKIYYELKTEANKRSWKDIEIKPFRFPENTGLGIGLEIISYKSKQFTLTQVYCQIFKITHSYDVEYQGNMQIPLLSLPSFQRTTDITNKNQTNNLNLGQVIAVAKDDGNRVWIIKNDALTDLTVENNILHKLTIGLDGNLESIGAMDRCTLYCDLLCSKKDPTSKFELSLTITERLPPYEI